MSWTCTRETFSEIAPAVCGVTVDAAVAGDPNREDPNQKSIISAPLNESLFVIAGPGSGKTTSAALRLLKLVYVDGVEPDAVFATTFTRKAAAELRSRIISWGEGMRDALNTREPTRRDDFDALDLNKMMIGTLDSLAQEVLNDHKRAGDPRPAPVEEHILKSLLLTQGIFPSSISRTHRRADDHATGQFLRNFYGREWSSDPGRATALVEIRQRLQNDRVDQGQLLAGLQGSPDHQPVRAILNVVNGFDDFMRDAQIYDFSSINITFLERLANNTLEDFLTNIKFVLVDEYQDTNYSQESVYFQLAQAAARNGGSITVVGDDDQSLYRFRGATVELFAGFENRIHNRIGVTPRRVALNRSYRSTTDIVDFVNQYSVLDPGYQAARVLNKPPLIHGDANTQRFPIFGIFRDSEQAVAEAIAQFTARLVSGQTISVRSGGINHNLRLDPADGSAGDIAVLTYSTGEYGDRKPDGRPGRERFPLKLRDALEQQTPPVSIFNPRGRPLRDIPSVQELLGNILDCLDPDGLALDRIQERYDENGDFSPRYVQNATTLSEWRNVARGTRDSRSPELARFVENWGIRTPTRRITARRARVSLNDIIFKLIKWLPSYQTDIEHLAWLEAVQRAVTASAVLQGFAGDVLFVPNQFDDELSIRSVMHAYQRVLFPIAEDLIEVSEDALETLPRDRLNIMTIHQSKGLEFPITIVDIGAAMQDLRWMRPRSRFPTGPDTVHKLESYFRPYCDIGLPARDGLDRAFDDLVRNYFVAFSRAQDVLILAGHTKCVRRPRGNAKPGQHVGAGWCRPDNRNPDGSWPWEGMGHLVLIEDSHL